MRAIDLFDRGAEAHPDRVCLRSGDAALSYREARAVTQRIAAGLAAEGFAPGAKAAVFSGNDPLAFLCILGLLRAGLVWLPINPRNPVAENAQILAGLDCDVLFYHSEFAAALQDIRRAALAMRRCVCIDGELREWFERFPAEFPVLDDEPSALAAISATGGTTGRPKGVMMSQRNFVAFSEGHEQVLNRDFPAVYLAAAPMTHVAGRICFPVLKNGGTVVVLARPDPQAILEAIPRYRVTRLFLPPTAVYALLAQPNVREFDYGSLRYFMYGAAPMSVQKLKEAIRVFGPVMTQGYGQTEAPMLVARLTPEEHFKDGRLGGELAPDERLASCGRPTPFVRVEIMDDRGRLLPRGETGEIVVRGDIVMQGYYKDPEATAETSRHGWHHTGDIGRFDAEGFLHIVDRKKDMIVSGGFNVYSSEVEQVILALPGVQDCAVVGVPDEKWGEAVKAIVQALPGAALRAEDIVAACRPRLGGVKTPKSVELWPELPRSAAGKVLKRAIRDRYWQGRERKV
ncbi:MAG: class I adenylate-forming enzyme family protein [Betaproteobacteria bacterium]